MVKKYIHLAFEHIVSTYPNYEAIRSEHDQISYEALNKKSNQLAHLMLDLGLSVGASVGVLLPSGTELVSSLMACFKTGITYVPMAVDFAPTKLNQVINDTKMKVLITNEEGVNTLKSKGIDLPFTHIIQFGTSAKQLISGLDLGNTNLIGVNESACEVFVQQEESYVVDTTKTIANYSNENPSIIYPIDNSSYIFYTSGTTGKSKAIVGSQESISHYINWHATTFNVNTSSRISQIAAVTFDASLKDILTALISGATLCIPEAKTKENMVLLGSWLAEEKVTLLQTVPSLFRLITDGLQQQNISLTTVEEVVLAGEKLYGSDVLAWRAIANHKARISNLYGLTETTVLKSCYHIPEGNLDAGMVLPVGKAISNSLIAVINEKGLCNRGELGEVYIKSPFVTKGYLDTTLNTNLFVQNPLVKDREDLVCRTGDIGRYDNDGNLELLGRIDDQIKLHGVRVDLDAIRGSLLAISEITQVELLLNEDADHRKSLICYYSGKEINATDLRALLAEELDRAYLPEHYVYLEAFPLTLNGKVDKQALPKPEALIARSNYIAPEGAIEESLAAIWLEVLNLPEGSVGRNDSFFDVGGSSLKAIQLISRIYKKHEVQLSIGDIFNNGVLQDQAALIGESTSSDYEAIPQIATQDYYPVSHAQKRVWLIEQHTNEARPFNGLEVYRLKGDLNTEALDQAFKQLIDRHESLRTVFKVVDGNPMQSIRSVEECGFEVGVEEGPIENKESVISAFAKQPFDLSVGPMFRVKILKLATDDHELFFSMHHIISDEWSTQILVRDLVTFYNSIVTGKSHDLKALPIQYKDYAAWQKELLNSDSFVKSSSYWKAQLADAPVLELASDRPRPEVMSHVGSQHYFKLSERLSEGIKAVSQQGEATLFMGVTALVKALLYSYTGQTDITVGTPVAGRDHADLEDQIGLYLNALAIRTQFSSKAGFMDLLNRVKQNSLAGFDHQQYPFDLLVEELGVATAKNRAPLFDVAVILQNVDLNLMEELQMEGLTVNAQSEDLKISKGDLRFQFVDSGDFIDGSIEYSTDLYDEERIIRMVAHMENILEAVIESPEKALQDIEYLEASEVENTNWFSNEIAIKEQPYLHQQFEAIASKYDTHTAIVEEGQQVSYADLNKESNQLAHMLLDLGIKRAQTVGVLLPSGAPLVSSLIACLKTGITYVPLSTDFSKSKLAQVMNDTGMTTLITNEEELNRLNEVAPISFDTIIQYSTSGKQLLGDLDLGGSDLIELQKTGCKVLQKVKESYTATAHQLEEYPTENINIEYPVTNSSYIFYTSGTTGKSKAIVGNQQSISQYINWHAKTFNVTPVSRISQIAAATFDASLKDILTALISGATLCIPSAKTKENMLVLSSWLAKENISILQTVPSLFRLITDALNQQKIELNAIDEVVLAGEKLYGSDVLAWRSINGYKARLSNLYGLTETTVLKSCYHVPVGAIEPGAVLPVGKAIDDAMIAVINNSGLSMWGELGEVYIKSPYITKGYLDTGLNQQLIVQNPLVSDREDFVCRTGDIGRYDSEGNLELLGRIDDQIKLHGVRVDLDGIRGALLSVEGISQVELLLHEDNDHQGSLLCYYSGTEINKDTLRNKLAEQLDRAYMPDFFVYLAEFPLTLNGKVDKRALPKPSELLTKENYEAPEGAIEESLAGIWQEVLSLPEGSIGRNDSFFDLGGSSLKAIQLISRIFKKHEVQLSIGEIFNNGSLKDQAALINQSSASTYEAIPKVEEQEHYALSHAQRRLWVLDQLQEGLTAYSRPISYDISGDLTVTALTQAFETVMQRHESLRTIFKVVDGEPRQFILPLDEVNFEITQTDISSVKDKEAKANDILETLANTPFLLNEGPLFKVTLVQFAPDQFRLLFAIHHIISDEWSMEVLIKDVVKHYNHAVEGTEATVEALPIQYKDYAAWQLAELSGDRLADHRGYWLNQLSGTLPVLDLPSDHKRPESQTYNGAQLHLEFSKEGSQGFQSLLKQQDSTLFMGLTALVKSVLHRYTGQDDIIIGTPVAGREHADLEQQIGFYINNLPIRSKIDKDEDFETLLSQVKDNCLAAYEHQIYPFDLLVDELDLARDLSRFPLFDVAVVVQSDEGADEEVLTMNGLEVASVRVPVVTSLYDITFWFRASQEGDLSVHIEYNTDIYNEARIATLGQHLSQLLEAILCDPKMPIAALPMLNETEQKEVIAISQGVQTKSTATSNLVALFEAQVKAMPDAIALQTENQAMSYTALNEKANALAHYLKSEYQLASEQLVGVLQDRSEWMLISILGILKAGGAYVPIDKNYPEARINYMLKDAEISLVLSDEAVELAAAITVCNVKEEEGTINQQLTKNSAETINNTDLAYVIYTSGSTGTPKGVMIEHHSIVNYVQWANEAYFNNKAQYPFAAFTSLSFDLTVTSLWSTLLRGDTVVILPNEDEVQTLKNVFTSERIKAVKLTPSHVLAVGALGLTTTAIEVAIVGGEALTKAHEQVLRSLNPDMRIYNEYGPTEATVGCTMMELVEGAPITIGQPIQNTEVYVLNDAHQLVSEGVKGDLYIGGAGLFRGYVNQPQRTMDQLISNPFGAGVLYKTGDIASWNEAGTLNFFGRSDDQVKIHGYRIELGEIATVLANYDAIESFAVSTMEEKDSTTLALYFTAEQEEASTLGIRQYLQGQLPSYMVPTYYKQLDHIPLTTNGKLDKAALPKGIQAAKRTYEAPVTATEKALVQIWEAVLQESPIGRHDNFFEMGGNSLKAIRVVSSVAKDHGATISLRDIFAQDSLKELAAVIDTSDQKQYQAIANVPEAEYYIASYAQKRMWALSQFEEAAVAYNTSMSFWFEGALNKEALDKTFLDLVTRHESLRTVFVQIEDVVHQKVLTVDTDLFKIEHVDLTAELGATQKANALLKTAVETAMDLEHGPLIKIAIYQVAEDKYLFSLIAHHIISDEWSVQLLVQEFEQLYNANEAGIEANLAPLAIQYKDYAAWEAKELEGEQAEAHQNYWLTQLGGEITPLELPLDHTRPAIKTYNGKHHHHQFDAKVSQLFNKMVQANNATGFMGALTLINALMHRYTGATDICIGTPASGRVHPDLEHQIGFYLNTLVMRNQVESNSDFNTLLAQVKEHSLGAFAHQVYPFDVLVEELNVVRDLSRSPLFDVMVVWQDEMEETEANLNGITIEDETEAIVNSKFDLTFYFSKRNDNLFVTIEYNTDLFHSDRITRMATHLEGLLKSVVAQPNLAITKHEYLPPAESDQILARFNATAQAYPKGGSFLAGFDTAVVENPNGIAIRFGKATLTYKEANTYANQLANYLTETHNIKQGSAVGLLLDRSEWMLVAMLSVLKCGAIYVPIDKSYPQSRINYILEDCGAALLITDTTVTIEAEHTIDQVDLGALQGLLSNYAGSFDSPVLSGEELAYMIYTSGSTGTPKGVQIRHASVQNLMYSMARKISATAQDALFAVTTYAFDMSVVELFLPLHIGGTVIIADAPSIKSPEAIIEALATYRPSIMQATPGFWQMLVDAGWQGDDHLRIITGGEALSPSLGAALIAKTEKLWNMYGPTETTVYSTWKLVNDVADIPYIGTPVDNMQAYILDDQLQPVPIGVVGTLYMSGRGIAVGYQNKPELTADRFIASPFEDGAVLYNTGDLCSWSAEGDIKYLGRIDHQLKIRGYRIEVEEIIAAILAFEGVQQSVVVGASLEGEKYLVGYYTADESVEVSALRTHLLGCLPEYMIPTYLVLMDVFPLTPNGKIDKRALPDPTASLVREYVAPTNDTEKVLVAIWEEVLGKEQIGIKDNFFELGGHSLKGIQIVSRIYKELSKKIELKNIFMYPVLEELAEVIIKGDFEEYTPITNVPLQETYVPSYPQKRIWIMEKLESSGEVYNMPTSYWFNGTVDRDALKRTFETIIERHEVFRTVFVEEEHGPMQKVTPMEAVDFDIDFVDLRAEANPKEFALGLAHNASQEMFDLGEDVLIKVSLFQVADAEYLFFFNIHHIIGDEWSLQVLNREIIAIYNAYQKGEDHELAPLTIQYKDYAAWQQQELSGDNLERHKDYWLNKLGGDIPTINLSTDMPRPPIRKFNGDRLYFKISPEVTAAFQTLLANERSTLFMGLLTVVKSLLTRYTGQEEMIIGTAITGRSHTDLEDQIGFYSNTLPFKSAFNDNDSFASYLETVKTTVLEAFDHRIYPFDKLVDDTKVIRDLSRSPIIDTMVILQDANMDDADELALSEIDIEETNVQMPISKFDLSYYFKERDGGMIMTIEYDTDIFFKERIEAMGAHLMNMLAAVVAQPEKPIFELDYLTEVEQAQVTETFNEKQELSVPTATLAAQFEAQVAAHPDRVAFVDDQYTLTYGELNEKANQVAHYLRAQYDIQSDDIISIIADHNEILVIGILGIIKAGAAYLPINPKTPIERINYQLTDANAKVVLTDHFEGDTAKTMISLPEIWDTISTNETGNLEIINTVNDLGYVIYTSGSTGKPKGVMIEQESLLHLCEWHESYYEVNADSRITMYCSISFDASVWELWPTLLSGARIYMAAKKQESGFNNFIDWVTEEGITHTFLPTAICKYLIQSGKEVPSNLKVLTGGDDLGTLEAVPFTIYNNYGPTEATVVSTVFKVDQPYTERNIPIGKPLSNKEIYILDDQLNPLPVGYAGEIYIGGAGIARGYINREDLTAANFIPNPFGGGRLYKTGDMAKWLADGNIEFIGRSDFQVNIRGQRIELGEIEATLMNHEQIKQAVVTVFQHEEDEYLVGYYLADEVITPAELKEHLKQFLPNYMIPGNFIQVEKFPLTLNGKIDKRALPKPTEVATSKYVAPRNETEVQMVKLWEDILDREDIGIEDNFFEIGGHSMKALQMVSRVNSEMDLRINLGDVIGAPYIKDLAELISNSQEEYNNIITLSEQEEINNDLFFFPPLMGTSLSYMGIVKLLKDDFNCYGIQDNGFDYDDPFEKTLDDKAWNFARQIMANTEPKHVWLLGFSLGASVAFETAKILEGKGYTTRLILIDRNISRRKPKLTEELRQSNENELQYLEGWLRTFEYGAEQTERIQRLWRNNLSLNNKYKQRGKVKGDIVAFKAKKNISNTFLNMKDWEKYTSGNFEHLYLEGNHYDAIQSVKNLEYMVEYIMSELQKSE